MIDQHHKEQQVARRTVYSTLTRIECIIVLLLQLTNVHLGECLATQTTTRCTYCRSRSNTREYSVEGVHSGSAAASLWSARTLPAKGVFLSE